MTKEEFKEFVKHHTGPYNSFEISDQLDRETVERVTPHDVKLAKLIQLYAVARMEIYTYLKSKVEK